MSTTVSAASWLIDIYVMPMTYFAGVKGQQQMQSIIRLQCAWKYTVTVSVNIGVLIDCQLDPSAADD